MYKPLTEVIKAGCKAAVWIAEKVWNRYKHKNLRFYGEWMKDDLFFIN